MLESLECNSAKKLKKQAYKTMIPVDSARPITGLKDKKWGIIVYDDIKIRTNKNC